MYYLKVGIINLQPKIIMRKKDCFAYDFLVFYRIQVKQVQLDFLYAGCNLLNSVQPSD